MRMGLLTYLNRASLCALFLTYINLAVYNRVKEQSQRDRSRMVIFRHILILRYGLAIYLYVGFYVARSDPKATPRPMYVGRARKVDPTFLFLYVLFLYLENRVKGSDLIKCNTMIKKSFITFIVGFCMPFISYATLDSGSLPDSTYDSETIRSKAEPNKIPRFPTSFYYLTVEGYTHSISTWNDANYHRTDCSYNSKGDLTQSIDRNWSNESNDWINSGKIVYEYNDRGQNIIEAHFKWDLETNEWTNDYKYVFEYVGGCTQQKRFEWINSLHDWVNTNIWEYDGTGEQTLIERYEFSETSNKMVGVDREVCSHENIDGKDVKVRIDYDWSTETDNWIPKTKSEHTEYTETGSPYDINSEKIYTYIENQWVLTYTFSSSTDSNGNQVEFEYCTWENGKMKSGQHEYWGYDNTNSKISYHSYIYYGALDEWKETAYTNTEDISNDAFTSITYQDYCGEFIPVNKSTCYLDSYGRTISRDNYTNINFQKPDCPEEYTLTDKHEYAYDQDGKISLEIEYFYKEENLTGGWKDERGYDDKDRMTSIVRYNWSIKEGIWQKHSKWESAYSEDGKLIKNGEYYWSNKKDDWNVDQSKEYTFNSDGSVNQYIWEESQIFPDGHVEDVTSVTTYYYPDGPGNVSITNDSADISVERHTLIFNREGDKEIYTIDGRLIYSGNTQIISLPSDGIYLIHTSQGNYKILVK